MEHLNKQTAGKKKKALLIVGIALAALLLIAGGLGLYAASEIGGWGGDDSQLVTVTVEKGASTAAIASALKEEGVIGSKALFRLYSKLNGGDGTYQFGNHKLPKKAAYKDVIATLQQTAVNENVATVTIPEGYSLPQIATALEEAGVCGGDAFLDALQTGRFEGSFEAEVSDSPLKILKMEGYCFPDTYQFEKGSDPAAVAQTMLAHFDSQITPEMRARMDELGMSLEETVTLASIIQKESFTNEDMKQVSGVFHNRMAAGSSLPMLQSDVTIVFLRAYDAYGLPYTEEQSEAYNTYTVTGLPIGPVACPGKAALEAALWPASHDYYYFVTDADNNYLYAKTFPEHEKNVAQADATRGK
ncbi:endolytic transglycosylase MltG [Bittarella massiliensis (ex Durand et al. 2017)]|uniref:endolytic transglycosylase MltG n=1 Tax=Bittarella massiliensis (ex Durand et al. 2017) TaxID=1720313 RepID=UPI001AA10BC6|nr:endolytic transglycosylase MltG [Bittarella massiliensis (ex Durand et al. 2017)]MBO1679450.1 endolytic transglycosylase MltG [Bittarella massiliensis (ex Durand et al. 2017)]